MPKGEYTMTTAQSKKEEITVTVTVLCKEYPGTGKAQAFSVVDDTETGAINRLVDSYGYCCIATGQPFDIDPWSVLGD
jgi:hypothetical protein